jgi:hypothetical protein
MDRQNEISIATYKLNLTELFMSCVLYSVLSAFSVVVVMVLYDYRWRLVNCCKQLVILGCVHYVIENSRQR